MSIFILCSAPGEYDKTLGELNGVGGRVVGPSHILNFVYGGGKFFFELITIIIIFGNIICQIVFDE